MGAISPPSMNAPVNDSGAVPGLLQLLQLGRRAREAGSLEELGFIAVNETRILLDYRQAALWLGGDRRQVTTVSGVPQVDPNAPFLQWLKRCFSALAPLSTVHVIAIETLPPLLAEEWSSWLPAHALCIPLLHAQATAPGVLLLARDQPWQEAELAIANELGSVFGHALFALRPRPRLPVTLWHILRQPRAWWKIAAAVLVVSVIPVRLSALAGAEVTPVEPFIVRAPMDGVIDHLQMMPNQQIAAGAPLFDLDATSLRGQYASANKAYETAQEQYRQVAQQAVTDDKSRVELAERRGDMNLRAVDLKYAAAQLDRVQVHAERAGVAVFDDVNDWVGKAVVVGEKVLMLADPDKVELTAYMPVGDQINLQPGSEVVFYPQAAPFSSYRATVQTVAYRAAPTDAGVLAYRIKASFDTSSHLPRLGLSGSARLYAGRVPLIYAVLRRPLTAVRQWLGW